MSKYPCCLQCQSPRAEGEPDRARVQAVAHTAGGCAPSSCERAVFERATQVGPEHLGGEDVARSERRVVRCGLAAITMTSVTFL